MIVISLTLTPGVCFIHQTKNFFPFSIARFCVFDSCQSYGAFSAFRSRGSVQSSYFVNCGRSAIVANDCAKLSINHCEFAQTERGSEQTLSSSQSDVTLNGCYFHAGSSMILEAHKLFRLCQLQCILYDLINSASFVDAKLIVFQGVILCSTK